MVSFLKSILCFFFQVTTFTVKLAEFDVFYSQYEIVPVFFLNQSSIVFLFLKLSANYILIQKIISTGIQNGITSYKSIQTLPCLW